MTTDTGPTGETFSEKVAQSHADHRSRRRRDFARRALAMTSTRERDSDQTLDNPDRFLAIAESTIDGTRMWVTADGSRAALEDLEYDEHPEDWRPVHLFDLDNDGAHVPFVARLAWGYTFQTSPTTTEGA